MEVLDIRIDRDVHFLKMQRSAKLNTLNEQLSNELFQAIINAYKSNAKAIVIEAQTKSNVWSAGHDIKELPLDKSDPLESKVAMEKLLRAIEITPIPIIALVSGTVWGGACDLCFSCDMIIASENSSFAITPAKIGIPYNASGIMHFINQLGLNKAKEMFFTAEPICAKDALKLGIINHLATLDDLYEVLDEKLLNPIRRNSILSISAIKRQFNILAKSASSLSAVEFERIESWRKTVYSSDDYQEGLKSFMEKRPANYTGKARDLDINDLI